MELKQSIDVISKIVIVFLIALLLFSVLNGAITLFMVIGALAVTYIFIYYWEKRFIAHRKKKVQVK